MKDIAIDIQNIEKVYKIYENPVDRLKESLGLSKNVKCRDHYALNDVSFQVKKGETVGIIGTNGSGKSTLLKIITGVLNPTSGNVDIDGRVSALLELGAGFNMEYTGIKNIYLNGMMLGFKKEEIDERLDEILRFADIGDFVNQPVKTYSSGMFVRLAFAVAINIDPEVLIVDEALSVGDVFFQAKCFQKFEEFKRMGKTILIVSHDLSSISKYCDRVILLNKGVIIEEGSPKQIVDLYKKLLVNQHVSSSTQSTCDSIADNDMSQNNDIYPEEASVWKEQMEINPNPVEYGTKDASIEDFAILDHKMQITNSVEKGEKFAIKMKVLFFNTIYNPIFAFTIKDRRGTEITGTNTMFEGQTIEKKVKGEEVEVIFTQEMNLQGGEYLLSLGCTGYRDGDFTVYHRLYDICSMNVISDKNTVGYYDMKSEVEVI